MYVCTCGLIGSAEVDMISDYFSLSGHIKKNKKERKGQKRDFKDCIFLPVRDSLFTLWMSEAWWSERWFQISSLEIIIS